MQVQALISRIILILALACIAACAAPGPPKPVQLEGSIISSAGLNPDYQGRASPVVVRVFQLKAAGAFESADFYSLYEKADAVLAADLIASDEFRVQPGQTLPYDAQFDPATRFVGVIAAFRDIENASWRSYTELPEGSLVDMINILRDNHLKIDLQDLAVSVAIVRQ